MSRGKPRIGITGPDHGGLSAWLFTAWAVRRAGGKPIRIRPLKPRTIEDIDGLIIGGGADVSPELYGQHRMPDLDQLQDRALPGWRRLIGLVLFPLMFLIRRLLVTKTTGLNQARDDMEERLIHEAFQRRLPVLGICRGMQLLNVAAGGSLHQSIKSFYEESPAIRSVLPRKRIEILPDSLLAGIVGASQGRVNALHDQAIDQLGERLQVCAREPSGVIQAIEHRDRSFLLGVQWHPEYLPQRPEQGAIFRALVRAARGSEAR